MHKLSFLFSWLAMLILATTGLAHGASSLDYTDRIIIRFKSEATKSANPAMMKAAKVAQTKALSTKTGIPLAHFRSMSLQADVLKLSTRMPLDEVARLTKKLAASPDVAYAIPDSIKRVALRPNDPLYNQQWHYHPSTIERGSANVEPAWDITQGSPDLVIAVVDTGVLPHADFAGRLLPGYDFISEVARANDGDNVGRDNDANDAGDWVSAAESNDFFGPFYLCGESESSWHGTHVAGTIAANTNNALGVAGINWNAKILPVRVLGKCGGYDSDVVDGMRWAAGLEVAGVPNNPTPARVVNLSLGGFGDCHVVYQQAINEVVASGAVVVLAAGNEAADASFFSPGNCSNGITVHANDRNGAPAFYSNFGTVVEISAPGGDTEFPGGGVLSTLDSGTTVAVNDSSYKEYQGTSMAAPHVAGVVSLMLSVNPALTPPEVLEILQATSRPFSADVVPYYCTIGQCGAGIVDAVKAVSAAKARGKSTTTVVEFYNSMLKHYFLTAHANEATGIDLGLAGPGWSRTGLSFNAWLTAEAAPANAVEVCRFYGSPGLGPNSHFYTVAGEECEGIKRAQGWIWEQGNKFYIIPSSAGACPSGTLPVYRTYNNRYIFNDSNHRYTTSLPVYNSMIASGWIGEGVVMCAPN